MAVNESDYADMGRPLAVETVKQRWSQGNTFTATLANLVEKIMGDKFTRSGPEPPTFFGRQRTDRGFDFFKHLRGDLNDHRSEPAEGAIADMHERPAGAIWPELHRFDAADPAI